MEPYFKFRRCCKLGGAAIAITLTALLNSTAVQAADGAQPVTAYQHVNFNGRSLSAGEGEVTIQELRSSVGNDRISSITVEPGYSVLACQNSRLRGRCEILSNDVSDLRSISFNDVVSSLLISKSADSSPVAVYKDVNFNGRFLGLEEGEVTIQELRDSVGNDRISSITIEPGYSVLACQNSGLRGRCEIFTSDTSDLRTISFNDVISSLSITKLADQPPVTVFQNVNFNGNSLAIEQEGDITIQDLRNSSVGNDVISSIQITDGYVVRACEHSRQGGSGRCEIFTSSISDLRTIGFNDTISFVSVTPDSVGPEPNTAPTASDLLLQTAANVPVSFTFADVENLATDADGDDLSIAVQIDNRVSQVANTFTFDPTSLFADLPLGEQVDVVFTYTAEDAEGATATGNIIITVTGIATQPQAVFTASVRVTEPDGDSIAGVTVSDALSGEVFGVTDADGNVVFDIPVAVGNMNLRLTADLYGDQITPLLIVDGADSGALEITMIQRVVANSQLAGEGWEVNIGSSFDPVVSWADDSFVTASGELVRDDEISLMYTTVDVSNQAELEAFPGSFMGTDLDGSNSTSIASLGTSEYVFVNRLTGAELQLADGASAIISLPLYIDTRPDTNELIVINSMIPIWSLNESTGVWIQETMGTVVTSNSSPTGMAVEATVMHFSWWNIDVPISTGLVTVNIEDIGMDGTVGVTSTPTSSDVAFRTGFGSVPIGGSFSTEIPAGSEYCFSGIAQLSNGVIGSTSNECANISEGENVDITLTFVGLDAPLAIAANLPASNAGGVLVNGFAGVPTRRVRINPTSFESNVTYTATNLPAGIRLNASSGTAAELVGIPENGGVSNVVVTGTNTDGETDVVSVQYEIEALASVQELTVLLFGSFEENTVRLNENNPGGTDFSVPRPPVPPAPSEVVSWELVGPDPFPVGLFFDESNGEFFIPFNFLFEFEPDYWDWTGLIRGTFPDGRVENYSVTFIFR